MKKITFKLFSLILVVVLILLCSACRSSEPTSGKVPSNTETESKEPVKLVYTPEVLIHTTISNPIARIDGVIINEDQVGDFELAEDDPYYEESITVLLGTGFAEGEKELQLELNRSMCVEFYRYGIRCVNYSSRYGDVSYIYGTDTILSCSLLPKYFIKPYENEIDKQTAENLALGYIVDLGMTEFKDGVPEGYVIKTSEAEKREGWESSYSWVTTVTAVSNGRETVEIAEVRVDGYGRLYSFSRSKVYGRVDARTFPNYSEQEALDAAQQKLDALIQSADFGPVAEELHLWRTDYYYVDGELVPCLYYAAYVYESDEKTGDPLMIDIRILIQTE